MAARAASPRIQTELVQRGDVLVRERLDLRGGDQALLVSHARHLTLDVTPLEGAVLRQVVALVVPGGLAAAGGRRVAQEQVHVAEILDVDLVPDVLALADEEALLALEHGGGQPVGLDALLVAGAAAGPVDGGRADDGDLHAGGVVLAGVDDDLVDVAVEGVVGEVEQLVDAVPVVVLLGAEQTPGVGAEVLDGEDTGARGVDQPERTLGGVLGSTLGDGLSGGDVIAIGAV